MDGSTGPADNELSDLEGGEGALEGVGHTNMERGEGVVCVLIS